MMTQPDHIHTPNPAAQAAGFRFGEKGTHTSRTMMLAELTELLAAVPANAARGEYAEAIIEDNILGKQRWRRHYNQVRPHSALGYKPPAPVTWSPGRPDPASATWGLQPYRPFPPSVSALT